MKNDKKINDQISRFKNGFPWLDIVAPATAQKGITILDSKAIEEAEKYYSTANIAGKSKFVPASGAASRMFKDLFAGLDAVKEGKDITGKPAAEFVSKIAEFPFYSDELFLEADSEKVLSNTLTSSGLNYGAKPKGVLKFHKYSDGEVRTAFAEHLVEAQCYMKNPDKTANLVVTISPEHRPLFDEVYSEIKKDFEAKYDVKYKVNFTIQDKETDTVAVDMNNEPFITDDGSILFRPAGHGALIYNLNKINDELVSIKNIDNVSHERFLNITAKYKKVLMGKCLELRDVIHSYLRELDDVTSYESSDLLLSEIEKFLDDELCISLPKLSNNKQRADLLREKLNRPIRVCGMVKNLGEPGGGPFIIKEKDGSTSLQILESVQINPKDPKAVALLSQASHFNPVDLVCCLKDYKGENFDLLKYVDSDTGFISSKSFQGRELKALELPGLWNGAMSKWNTAFVEVPVETFNPVKVVLDLLRPEHID